MGVDGLGGDPTGATVSLGAQWVATEDVAVEPIGWLGLRTRETRTPVHFLDWTIDGILLRSMLRLPSGPFPDERTRMRKGEEGKSWVSASLRALLDGYADAEDEWVRYDTGRTAFFFCPQCGHLSCPAITAHVEFRESTVRWREVGYETDLTDAPAFETFDRISLTFDRAQHEGTIRALLATWGDPRNAEKAGS